jgi:hypothetical protein
MMTFLKSPTLRLYPSVLATFATLFSLPSDAAELELRTSPSGAKAIYASCGAERKCLLDTGAENTKLLIEQSADQANSAAILVENRSAIGSTGTICERKSLARFSALGLERENYDVLVCPTGPRENTLGVSFFKDQSFALNFSSGTLTFTREPIAVGESLRLKLHPKGHVFLPISIQQKPYFGLFDTGAWPTAVDLSFVESHPDLFEFRGLAPTPIQDAAGNVFRAKRFLVKDLKLGSLDLSGSLILAWDFGPLRTFLGEDAPFVLGLSTLMQADWWFDLRSGEGRLFPLKP